jgi:hypothetical protein
MRKNNQIQEVLTHWSYLARGLQYDPAQFYGILRGKIESEQINGVRLTTAVLSQKGMLSRKREYLRIQYDNFVFDVCGAPFGESNFFFSYWMGVKNMSGCLAIFLNILLSIPVVGLLIQKSLDRLTYFEQDTAEMFNSLVSSIIMAEVDSIMEQGEIEPVPDEARVPNDKKLLAI